MGGVAAGDEADSVFFRLVDGELHAVGTYVETEAEVSVDECWEGV